MVEKVQGEVDQVPAVSTPFTTERVKVCQSCGAVNPASATKCHHCGDPLDTARTTNTVPATCPHCAGDRPMVPATEAGGTGEDTGTGGDVYHGPCPHCGQTEASANEAKAALEKGQFPEWGQRSNRFFP